MFTDLPLLSLLIWLPVFGGIAVLINGDKNSLARPLSLIIAVLTLLLSLGLYTGFDNATHQMQFAEQASWIATYNINYSLGVDGFSMPLIILTAFSTLIVVVAGWEVIQHRVSQYMAAFLIMEGLMIAVFSSLDAILFYVFFEAMLIPLFLVIGIWGGPNRVYATIKFFLYTLFGSVFLLLALLYLHHVAGSFSILDFHKVSLTMQEQIYLFLAFLIAFAVKVPMWPVHTWLPDAHVEAPTGGSVILAAITLKIGGYGLIRFALPITPDASMALDWLVIGLSLTAVVYIGFVALAQSDLKKLIAYSSIAHMGFVTLGLFIVFRIFANSATGSGAVLAIEGAMIQMISHGFIAAAMFLSVGVLYDRMHTREISAYGGVINTMPIFGGFAVFFAMANAGLPGTSGFVGEFMVILAAFQANFWYAFFAATTLILGAAYTLWMVKRVMFGEVANDNVAQLTDINRREFLMLASLAVIVLVIGLWPAPITEVMHASVEHLLTQISQSKI
ncbi:MAG: NADH-quinone oxidoreductase subunit M [Gammaproteobacteria bacterium]|nr:MAG: NADH-quinone oxidoreductase subunit M [Gammaproteobacteria bacterium]